MQQPNYKQKPFFSGSFRSSIAIGSYFSFDVGCGKRRVGRILEARKADKDDRDFGGALQLYQSCLENENENVTALVVLNLGYLFVNGPSKVSKDVKHAQRPHPWCSDLLDH